jgi:hypothetical protein
VVPSGASKKICKPMVCLAQTMHLSFTDTNTISKRKEERFHMTHVTSEFHRVRPKWNLSLWYDRCKPCTYVASRLALSPKGWKWASTWASSPSGTIRCFSRWFVSLRYIWHKPCTYLAPTLTLTLSPNGKKRDSTEPMSPRSSIWCVQNDFQAYGTINANRAPILHQD